MDEGVCNYCGFEGDWNLFLNKGEEWAEENEQPDNTWPRCPGCESDNVELIEEADRG